MIIGAIVVVIIMVIVVAIMIRVIMGGVIVGAMMIAIAARALNLTVHGPATFLGSFENHPELA